jgi:hypothetical protein
MRGHGCSGKSGRVSASHELTHGMTSHELTHGMTPLIFNATCILVASCTADRKLLEEPPGSVWSREVSNAYDSG